MQIVVTNGYSFLNKGDSAIALSLFGLLEERYPDATISFVSASADIDRVRYPDNIAILGRDLEILFRRDKHRTAKFAIFGARAATAHRSTDYGRAIREADLVVACGGGYLNDGFGKMILVHLEQLRIARKFRKPIVLANQSIGPFNSPTFARLAGRELRRVNALVVREEISAQWAKKLGVADEDLIRAPDLAFALHGDPPKADLDRISGMVRSEARPQIGMTVRDWTFPGSADRHRAQERYYLSMTEFVRGLVDTYHAQVWLLPQVIGPGDDDDRNASRKLIARLPPEYKSSVQLVDLDLHPLSLRWLIRSLDVLVGTRMHSNIFALTEGVPVLAIAYEHKTTGIMQSFGLANYSVPIENLDSGAMMEKFERILELRPSLVKVIESQARAQSAAARGGLLNALARTGLS